MDGFVELGFEVFGDNFFFSFGHAFEAFDFASGELIESLGEFFVRFDGLYIFYI